ncbi:hypothetical protein [Dyadobacter alkalitolerans]|uniref:hypothetical protein n=1 Tax=Dyadobacter alkalitolerans TaxID=492736 RepID=UPI00040911AC|nr:hypothetical protein [Dyadobacter alkalitolerans]
MEAIKIQDNKIAKLKMVQLGCIFCLFIISIACSDKKKDGENTDQISASDAIAKKENNSTVAAYVSFVNNDQNKMELDHAYASEALGKMTSAVSAMAGEVDFDIKGDLDAVNEAATKITKDPFDTSHADQIRKAAEILSGVLQNIQVAKYPGLANEAGEVSSAAMAIDPKTLTLDQKDAVKNFFAKGADLLEKMN